MAAETTLHTIAKDTWTLIAENKKVVAVQLLSQSSVQIYIGVTGEEPTPSTPGIRIARGLADMANAWSAAGLPDTTSVWAMSLRDPAEDVVVMSY